MGDTFSSCSLPFLSVFDSSESKLNRSLGNCESVWAREMEGIVMTTDAVRPCDI